MYIHTIGPIQVLGGNKRIYTSEKAKICTVFYFGTIIVIKKWKINICFFPLFLPESKDQKQTIYFKRPQELDIYRGVLRGVLKSQIQISNWQNPKSEFQSSQNPNFKCTYTTQTDWVAHLFNGYPPRGKLNIMPGETVIGQLGRYQSWAVFLVPTWPVVRLK